jgi:hypothetical protein
MDISENSGVGGVEILVVGTNNQGSDQPCRTCLVMQKSGTQAYLNIGSTADTGDWKLLATHPIEVAVQNTNQIFVAGTAADQVQLLWRD